MSTARGLFIFFILHLHRHPVGLIFTLRLVGRRRGYDNLIAPPQDGR